MGASRAWILIGLSLSFSARAKIFIEPSFGYTTGSIGQSGVPSLGTQAFILGGRVGYRATRLSLGADYSMGFGSVTQFSSSGSYRPTDIGIFAGYKLPLGLQAYGSIFLLSKAKIQPTENSADFSGQSIRVGIGWAVLRRCSINLEGTYRIYSNYDGAGLPKSIKGATLGGSLSFPLP